jgi:hypothetical protein
MVVAPPAVKTDGWAVPETEWPASASGDRELDGRESAPPC